MMITSPSNKRDGVLENPNQTCIQFNNNIYSNYTPDYVIEGPSFKKHARDIQAEIQKSIEGVKSMYDGASAQTYLYAGKKSVMASQAVTIRRQGCISPEDERLNAASILNASFFSSQIPSRIKSPEEKEGANRYQEKVKV